MKSMKIIMSILTAAILLCGCQLSTKREVDIATLDSEKIVNTSRGMYDYSVAFSDVASLSEESSQIVYGEVINVDYVTRRNGLCSTITEVQVLKSMKGDFQEGDIIKISAQQGIMSVQEYIDSMDPEFREAAREEYQQYSDEELNDIYIQQLAAGDIMLETGQKNVYFLCESSYYDTENTYCRIAGPENQFVEVSEGVFMNTKTVGTRLSGNYRLNTMRTSLLQTESESSYTYSLDELIAQMDL